MSANVNGMKETMESRIGQSFEGRIDRDPCPPKSPRHRQHGSHRYSDLKAGDQELFGRDDPPPLSCDTQDKNPHRGTFLSLSCLWTPSSSGQSHLQMKTVWTSKSHRHTPPQFHHRPHAHPAEEHDRPHLPHSMSSGPPFRQGTMHSGRLGGTLLRVSDAPRFVETVWARSRCTVIAAC